MKKILLLLLILFGASIVSAPAVVLKEYVSVKYVYSILDTTFVEVDRDISRDYKLENTDGISIGYGLKMNQYRVEFESTVRRELKVKSATTNKDLFAVSTNSFAINTYHDIYTNFRDLTFYVGLGVGLGTYQYDEANGVERSFAYQFSVSGGFSYEVSKDVYIDLGYKYLNGTFKTYRNDNVPANGKQNTVNPKTSEILLGMRYAF
jgi:opacity protein-like surface antigen